MEKIYYKTTRGQLLLFCFSLFLLALGLSSMNIITLAIVCLSVINASMLHFNIFIDTRNCNILNRMDFGVQVFTLVFSLIKFLFLTN